MNKPLLDSLHRDHMNLSRLMRIVAHELDSLAGGREADLGLLQDVLRYITGYSDVHHHPAEDRVYAELSKTSPHAAREVEDVVRQHDDLIRRGREFLEAIEAIEEAAIMRRDQFVELGRDYLAALGSHMGTEEGKLFPLAAEKLSESDWALLEAAAERPPDPLFGESVEREYRNLWRRIEAHTAGF